MVTSITGSGTMPTGLDPNIEQALEKVQDDVDFYAMLSSLGQPVTGANGSPLYWSDNRIHNLSADNFFGIKFAEGYEPTGQNLVFSGTLTSDQVAAVNAGKPIEMASSGGDSILQIDTKTGAVSATPANATAVAAATNDVEAPRGPTSTPPITMASNTQDSVLNELQPPPINIRRADVSELFHVGTERTAGRMKV